MTPDVDRAALPCATCGSTGSIERRCPECAGSGKESCPTCCGRGMTEWLAPPSRFFPTLAFSDEDCFSCAGRGVTDVHCAFCDATGVFRVVCPDCHKRPEGQGLGIERFAKVLRSRFFRFGGNRQLPR